MLGRISLLAATHYRACIVKLGSERSAVHFSAGIAAVSVSLHVTLPTSLVRKNNAR